MDLGDDGVNDYVYLDKLNSTTSPQNISFGNASPEKYNESFTTLKISSGSSGILQISNLNINQTINPIELNKTYFEDCYDCLFNFTYSESCAVKLDDLRWDFYGSKNYTVHGHVEGDSGQNATLQVKYSKFNLSFPPKVNWFDVFPKSNSQKNVTPYGQTNSIPIRNLTGLNYDDGLDLYIKINDTLNSCLNITFHNDSNTSKGTPILLSNTTSKAYYRICQNVTPYTNVGTYDNCDIYAWFTLNNCSSRFEIPYITYAAVCSGCYLNKTQLDYYNVMVD
jgi:hypothetical protein